MYNVYIEKWLKALNSGKYKQTKFFLKSKQKNSYSYCCLGVLCEITKDELKLKTKQEIEKKVNNEGLIITISFNNNTTTLPKEVKSLIDINDDRFFKDLVALNDDYNYNFNQIAKYIELYFENKENMKEQIKNELRHDIDKIFSK